MTSSNMLILIIDKVITEVKDIRMIKIHDDIK